MLAAGERFGRYEIVRTLGEGGMGTVYCAVDTRLGRRVALKVVRADRATDSAAREKAAPELLHEARAAATLEHVNAVAIYDVGQEGETTFIAMELVTGRSLRAYIGDASITTATRVRWLRDVARVLHAAHSRGLVHRDVKPENVMVRDDGVIKVLDFGIAWVRGEAPPPAAGAHRRDEIQEVWRSTFTRDGVFVGTPRYMSPEQVDGGTLDGRSDQFSWGVLAYELFAGKPPWPGGTESLGTLFHILETEPPALREMAPGLPRAIESVVSRAMRKSPDERFASMGEVVDTLDLPARQSRVRWIVPALAVSSIVAAGVATRFSGARRPSPASASPPALPAIAAVANRYETPPHIVLMLDAARGIVQRDGVLARWEDQSGSGNDAVAGSLAPTVVDGAIHGLPAVRFDRGQHLVVADAPSLRPGIGDFTVEVVVRHTRPLPNGVANGYGTVTGYGLLYSKAEAEGIYPGVSLFVNFPHPVPSTRFGAQTSWNNNVATTSDGLNDGKPHLFGARRRGTTLEVRLDGVAQGENNSASDDVSAVGSPAFIGANPNGHGIVQQLQGDIAELIVIRGETTAHAFEALEAELKKRFDL